MNKFWLICVVLAVAVVIGAVAFMFYSYTVNASTVVILSTDVTNSIISLRGTFSGSAIWYRGYHVDYRDGSLYINIKGSNIKLPNASGDFNIAIPNKYGQIKAIYLQDNTSTTLIWPKK